jgi:hypothetical protein
MVIEYKVWRTIENTPRHVGYRYIQTDANGPIYYIFEFKMGPNGLQRGPKQIVSKKDFYKTNSNEYMRLTHPLVRQCYGERETDSRESVNAFKI